MPTSTLYNCPVHECDLEPALIADVVNHIIESANRDHVDQLFGMVVARMVDYAEE